MKAKCVLSFFLLFTMLAFGQQDKKDKLREVKSSIVATNLNLTALESQKFWPLYLNCEEKTDELEVKIQQLKAKIADKGAIDKLSQKEALLVIVQIEAAEGEIFTLRKKLINDLKPVIGAKKILKLKMAEDDFKKLLLNKIKGKKD